MNLETQVEIVRLVVYEKIELHYNLSKRNCYMIIYDEKS